MSGFKAVYVTSGASTAKPQVAFVSFCHKCYFTASLYDTLSSQLFTNILEMHKLLRTLLLQNSKFILVAIMFFKKVSKMSVSVRWCYTSCAKNNICHT